MDTFIVRVGDALSAVYEFIGTSPVSLGITGFAVGNAALVIVWIWITILIILEHDKMTRQPVEASAVSG